MENKEAPKVWGDQIRLRITIKQLEALKKLMAGPFAGDTMSGIIRKGILLLQDQQTGGVFESSNKKISDLAQLLQREPERVRQECIEAICDLISNKTSTPAIVMEAQLHLSYRNRKKLSETQQQ